MVSLVKEILRADRAGVIVDIDKVFRTIPRKTTMATLRRVGAAESGVRTAVKMTQ